MPEATSQTPASAGDPSLQTGASVQGAPSVASQSTLPTGSEPAALARPEGVPEDLWDTKTGLKAADLALRMTEYGELKAAAEARRAAIPATADLYQPALPEGVKLPDGYAINPNDPRLPGLRELAHKEGWSQQQFSQVIALDMQRAQKEDADRNALITAERDKLGTNAPARIDAVQNWVAGTAESPEVAKQVNSMMVTASIVRHFERLQKALTSQGVDQLRTGHREGQPDPNADFHKQSFPEQRMAQYARNEEARKATNAAAR